MSGNVNVGQQLHLTRKFAKALASAAIVGTLALGAWTFAGTPTVAGGETRTISMKQVHTGESLTVTYMQNGRYVPSAMKKLNYLLRDWRRNEVITIDPKTIDLIWELHADLGSRVPIKVICGYRSPRTNAFLKRIGRKVAGKSQHMKGKAIDFNFPDVPLMKIRNSALARQVGGVGFYRGGFLHADSGNVRHWGGRISRSQMASIMREAKRYTGKRLNKRDQIAIAAADGDDGKKSGGLWGLLTGKKRGNQDSPVVAAVEQPTPALETAYVAEDDELADLSADAAAAEKASSKKALKLAARNIKPVDDLAVEDELGYVDPPAFAELKPSKADKKPLPKADPQVENAELAALASSASVESVAEQQPVAKTPGLAIPKPRLKPRVVLALAEAKAQQDETINIQPASAPPEGSWNGKKPSKVVDTRVSDSLGAIPDAIETETDFAAAPEVNAEGKTSLAAELRDGISEDEVVIRPVLASLQTDEPSWWSLLYPSAEASARRDGVPPSLDGEKTDVLPIAAQLGPDGTGPAASLRLQESADGQEPADGKEDVEVVVREGKSSLPEKLLRLSERTEEPVEETVAQ